jgi:hypothetical protein
MKGRPGRSAFRSASVWAGILLLSALTSGCGGDRIEQGASSEAGAQ